MKANNNLEVVKFIKFLVEGDFSKNTIKTQIRENNECQSIYNKEIEIELECRKTKKYQLFSINYDYELKTSDNYVETDGRSDYWCTDIDYEKVTINDFSNVHDEDGQFILQFTTQQEFQIQKLIENIIN